MVAIVHVRQNRYGVEEVGRDASQVELQGLRNVLNFNDEGEALPSHLSCDVIK